MLVNLLFAAAVILAVLALLAFLKVILVGSGIILAIAALICLVLALFLRRSYGARPLP